MSYNTNVPAQSFGLILPASKKKAPVKAPSSSLFLDAGDDDGGDARGVGAAADGSKRKSASFLAVNESVKRQQEVAARQAEAQAQAATAQHGDIFDYDSWLDAGARARAPAAAHRVVPKYTFVL